ncbi:nitroreductase family protein [Atopobium fossor]|uniref:nitroreductase family protein n=1 Tax=Atopobium fossor TaxID=39487 RepID=UPI0003F5EE99|nr:nitroreductase family protein [Atopobium fossor]
MSDFASLAHERYSCRSFSNKPVDPKLIEKIIDAALAAPTAVNKQPFRLWVLTGDAVTKFTRHTRYDFGAHTYLLVGAATDEAWTRRYDGKNFAEVDASIVATHIMLAIADLGLGTTWLGSFDVPALIQELPELTGYELVAAFPVGWPSTNAHPSPMHEASRNKNELVSYLE